MARRNRGEQQTITAADAATLEIGKDGAITVGIKKKSCAICGAEYTPISADKETWPKYRGKPFRQPNEWTPEAETAHRISHLSARARQVCGRVVNYSDEVKQEIADFIADLG
jgi:hypothetical protein